MHLRICWIYLMDNLIWFNGQIQVLYHRWSMQWWVAQGIWRWELWRLDHFWWHRCWVVKLIQLRTQSFFYTLLSQLRSLLELYNYHLACLGTNYFIMFQALNNTTNYKIWIVSICIWEIYESYIFLVVSFFF